MDTGLDMIYCTIVYADPGQGGEAFVNVVTAFGVDNTGVTDAWPALYAALQALSATGQIAYMPGRGRTPCASTPAPYLFLPSNIHIVMAPDVASCPR